MTYQQERDAEQRDYINDAITDFISRYSGNLSNTHRKTVILFPGAMGSQFLRASTPKVGRAALLLQYRVARKHALPEACFDLVGLNTFPALRSCVRTSRSYVPAGNSPFSFSSVSSRFSPFMVSTPSATLTSMFFSSMPGSSAVIS